MNDLSESAVAMRALAATEKILGLQELCRRLGAPEHSVRAWQGGGIAMPEFKFLLLVDILLDLDAR